MGLRALSSVFPKVLLLAGLGVSTAMTAACSQEADDEDVSDSSEDALRAKADDHWMYSGPMPALEGTKITVSLKGHTAHVTGLLPRGYDTAEIRALPHVRLSDDNGRSRIDVVYPIATANPTTYNSPPGDYGFHEARPYRPEGMAYPRSSAPHMVPWGGFPFLAYNDTIAFHGPITSQATPTFADEDVWYLRRGRVSAGCHRMMGEHVTELAHMIGVNMRKVYGANVSIENPSRATVTVIEGFDAMPDGKAIDVDYPTDVGAVRPKSADSPAGIAMFGSWVASEMPDGRDLPASMKWQGGQAGKWYVFREHARQDMVCSFSKGDLPALKTFTREMGGQLPRSICAKKACVVDGLHARKTTAQIKATCEL